MYRYFIACGKNSENLLATELSELGAMSVKPSNGGVWAFHSDMTFHYLINLYSRLAIRVLLPIADFYLPSNQSLYDQLYQIPWDHYFSAERSLLIQANIRNSGFNNSHFIELKTKDAICDYFRLHSQTRPNIDKHHPEIVVNVYIQNNQCQVSLDSSGRSLNKRGYRPEGAEASLRETLAATLIRYIRWDGATPFYDLMCGAGTIPIEAAWIASKQAPGLLTPKFTFQNWNDYDSHKFKAIIQEAREKVLPVLSAPIIANDWDSRNYNLTRTNSRRAGVESFLEFSQEDIFEYKPIHTKGVMILNPPYGRRVQPGSTMTRHFFQRLNDKLKQDFKGFTVGILSPEMDELREINMTPDRVYKVYNGNILCYFAIFKIY